MPRHGRQVVAVFGGRHGASSVLVRISVPPLALPSACDRHQETNCGCDGIIFEVPEVVPLVDFPRTAGLPAIRVIAGCERDRTRPAGHARARLPRALLPRARATRSCASTAGTSRSATGDAFVVAPGTVVTPRPVAEPTRGRPAGWSSSRPTPSTRAPPHLPGLLAHAPPAVPLRRERPRRRAAPAHPAGRACVLARAPGRPRRRAARAGSTATPTPPAPTSPCCSSTSAASTRDAPAERRIEPLLAAVFDVIDARYHEPISLRDVADAVGLTTGHLTTVVGRRTGRTVQQWITERRMREARRLLADTDLAVGEIAHRVGYREAGYFVRRFRAAHGVPPAAWRRAGTAGVIGLPPTVTLDGMEVVPHTDAGAFARLAHPLLEPDPVRHTSILTVLDGVRTGAFDPTAMLTVHENGGVVGALLRTAGHPALVSAVPPRCAGRGRRRPGRAGPGGRPGGVQGPAEEAEAFGAAWSARTGAGVTVGLRMRLFALDELVAPAGVAGAARAVGPDDARGLDLLARVARRRSTGVRPHLAAHAHRPRRRRARPGTGAGELLWEVDGEPVAQAAARAVVAGMSRIGPVYTPPEHRGQGYAAAVTAAAARWALGQRCPARAALHRPGEPDDEPALPPPGLPPALRRARTALRARRECRASSERGVWPYPLRDLIAPNAAFAGCIRGPAGAAPARTGSAEASRRAPRVWQDRRVVSGERNVASVSGVPGRGAPPGRLSTGRRPNALARLGLTGPRAEETLTDTGVVGGRPARAGRRERHVGPGPQPRPGPRAAGTGPARGRERARVDGLRRRAAR